MTSKSGDKSEPFKRAVGAAVRAIARQPEGEVTFTMDTPNAAAGKARLPLPSREVTAREGAEIRGYGDAFALRQRPMLQTTLTHSRWACRAPRQLTPSGAGN